MISFIIPHWNHKKLLYECISSVYETTGAENCEIIVVDNASKDGSAGYISSNFPGVIWVQNDTNLGYAKAVNQGVRLSRGNLLFLLNNDVRLLGGATENLASFLRGHPDAGAVAPALYYPDGRIQLSCRRFPTLSALVLESFGINKIGHFRRWKLTGEEHLRSNTVQQPMASALMVRKECWDAVGPLDEKLPLYFNDVDWCYRLYSGTDCKIYLLPEAKVIHHWGASTRLLGYKRRIEFFKGLIMFYRKHFPFFSAGRISERPFA